jgi:hypothetical protein
MVNVIFLSLCNSFKYCRDHTFKYSSIVNVFPVTQLKPNQMYGTEIDKSNVILFQLAYLILIYHLLITITMNDHCDLQLL